MYPHVFRCIQVQQRESDETNMVMSSLRQAHWIDIRLMRSSAAKFLHRGNSF